MRPIVFIDVRFCCVSVPLYNQAFGESSGAIICKQSLAMNKLYRDGLKLQLKTK